MSGLPSEPYPRASLRPQAIAITDQMESTCWQRLAQIREILAAPPPEPEPKSGQAGEHEPGWPCPVCRQGRMRPVREIASRPAALGSAPFR